MTLDGIEPLGHELDPDNPDDVDWLIRWVFAAEKQISESNQFIDKAMERIHELEDNVKRLHVENTGLRAEAVLRR